MKQDDANEGVPCCSEDVDPLRFLAWTFALASVRVVLLHPFTVALTWVRCRPVATEATSRSTLSVFRELVGKQGLLRSWQVALPTFIVAIGASEAIYLLQFEFLRSFNDRMKAYRRPATNNNYNIREGSTQELPYLRSLWPRSEAAGDFLAGFLAEGTRQVLSIPLTIVGTRQLTANFERSATSLSAVAASRLLFAENGIRSFYTSLGVSLLLGPPWTALWWTTYGQVKHYLYARAQADNSILSNVGVHAQSGKNADSDLLNTAAAVVASASCAVVFNPFLVVRTRMQATANATLRSVVKGILQQPAGRVRTLFAGVGATMLQQTAEGIVASATYEYAKKWSQR